MVYVVLGESYTVADVDLSQLYISNSGSSMVGEGFKITGASSLDMTGFAVGRAGDFNNDGYEDLLIGAFNSSSGSLYVVFGNSEPSDVWLNNTSYLTSSQVFVVTGAAAGDRLGYSVSGGFDLNGDGYDDIAVSAPNHSNGVGIVYVLYGSTSTTNIDLSTTSLSSSQGFVIYGDASETGFGYSLAMISDLDGDGYADLCIGSPSYVTTSGSVAVVYGGASNADLNVTNVTLSRGFTVEGDPYTQTGFSVSEAGDVNGDGLSDIVIGM